MGITGHCRSTPLICIATVVPTKSYSDAMFFYTVIMDLESIHHLCINPIGSIGLIHM